MPRQRCTICLRDDVQDFNAARKAGEPVRAIAKRFGVTPATADRHFHHEDHAKTRINIGDIDHIDTEIKKLIRAQNKAKKKRDSSLALQIAKELRAWFTLRTKASIATIGTSESKDESQLTQTEAVALAQAVIEGNLQDAGVRSWITSLAERIGPLEAGAPSL